MVFGSDVLRHFPFFYGYVVAAVGTIGMVATGPGQTPVIGTTITQLSEEMGLGRTTVSSLYLIATICSACTLPFVGRLLDRIGPPPLFALAATSLGLTCFAFAKFAHTSWQLGIYFYFLRLCGLGTLTLVSQNAINLWFQKKRGQVMGVCAFFNSLCLTGLFSSIVKAGVSQRGWRSTYASLGGLELVIILPLGALLLKQKPETYGLKPDGEAPLCSAGKLGTPPPCAADADADDEELCIGEDPECASLGDCEANEVDDPIDDEDGAVACKALPSAAAPAVPGAEKIGRATPASPSDSPTGGDEAHTFVGVGVRSLGVEEPRDFTLNEVRWRAAPALLFPVGLLSGCSMGSNNTCLSVAYATWYGRKHNGKIQGLANSLVVLGSAVGPAIVSCGHDFVGDYQDVLIALLPWPCLCMLVALCTRKPRRL